MNIRIVILRDVFTTESPTFLGRAAKVALVCAAMFTLPAQSIADAPFQYKQDVPATNTSPFPSLEQIFRDNAYVPTALMLAAVANDPDPEKVLSLLRQGCPVNEKDNLGRTALVWAVSPPKLVVVNWGQANEKVIKELLAYGADANAKDEDGETVLKNVILRYGDATVVKALLEHGADVNGGGGALMDSVQHTDVFRLLLAHGAHINFRGPDGVTVLDRAVAFGTPEVVHILLMHHPHITSSDAGHLLFDLFNRDNSQANQPYPGGQSGVLTILKLLVYHGLSLEASAQGRTALLWCASFPNSTIEPARLLIAYGAKVNVWDSDGWTPLMHAAFNTNVPLMNLLLAHGADINIRTSDGATALTETIRASTPSGVSTLLIHHPHISEADAGELLRATIHNGGIPAPPDSLIPGHVPTIINLLLLHGLDANARSQGRTPLLWCASIPQSDIATARLLIAHGAMIDAQDEEGRTPLIWASSNGNIALMKLLLAHGADVNAKSNKGRSALEESPNSSVAEILKQAGAK